MSRSKSGPEKITLADVAAKAKVSNATVSSVLHNRPTVKEETRDRVLQVMRELNFRPRRTEFLTPRLNCIGLIIREMDNPFYLTLAAGVKKYANEKNYHLLITSSESSHQAEEDLSSILLTQGVAGTIIAPVIDGNVELEHLFQLKAKKFPFVILEDVSGIRADVVSIDNIKATKRAVEYLISLGHTDIVHFAGPKVSSHARDRIAGFRDAFSETSLAFNKKMIVPCGAHFEEGYQTGLQVFGEKRSHHPTAVVCYNDVTTMGLLSALRELKIDVPQQVSVIGHDDIKFAPFWPPPLTTIHTPIEELGSKAAEVLIDRILSPDKEGGSRTILDAELMIRGTTREPFN